MLRCIYENPNLTLYPPVRYGSPVDMTPDMREACASRDIAAIFRLLQGGGMTQRQLADLVRMSQSEISEILKGRKVISYDVLVRVADGLSIPRGMMGLADLEAEPEEVDEDVERRKLLAAAGAIMFGAPVWGDPQPLTIRRVLVKPPSKVGISDLRAYEQTVAHLKLLDRRFGGMAAREPLVVTATAGEQLLKAQAVPEVHQRLRYAVSEAHRAAGWASDDVGLLDQRRYHVRQALDLAAGDPLRLAGILGTAGSMEKNHGDANYALKYFQLAQIGAATSTATDPQVGAVLAGETVGAYYTLGYSDKAQEELRKARQLFGDADASKSLPFFASYGKGFGVLASCELKLGNYDSARADGLHALSLRPEVDVRCNALDTIILATTNMQAGELREGIQQTQRALELIRAVGSQRIRDRLEPLEMALASRYDSTCRDLARIVQQVRVA